jgi:hypothetical protein
MDDVRKAKRGEAYCSELFKSYYRGILPEDVSNLWICYPLGVRENQQRESLNLSRFVGGRSDQNT